MKSEKVIPHFNAKSMPIKLEIASRVMSGMHASERIYIYDQLDAAKAALHQADKLIQAYNDSLEEPDEAGDYF